MSLGRCCCMWAFVTFCLLLLWVVCGGGGDGGGGGTGGADADADAAVGAVTVLAKQQVFVHADVVGCMAQSCSCWLRLSTVCVDNMHLCACSGFKSPVSDFTSQL